MFTAIILATILVLSIIAPIVYYCRSGKKARNFKLSLAANVSTFFGALLAANVFMFVTKASAAEAAEAATAAVDGWKYIAAALSTGLASLGSGIAVASGSSAALGALSEDSSIMGKALIFVAMGEGIALYGLLISLLILFV